MGTAQSGHYPIERRAGEIERLHIQGQAMALDAAINGQAIHLLLTGRFRIAVVDLLG